MKSQLVGLILAATLSVAALSASAFAEETTNFQDIRHALETLDSKVSFESDALVRFSNGNEYVMVKPTESKAPAQVAIAKTMPEGAKVPDLIQLNNGYFLLRVVTLAGGRKTFPILDNIPLEAKTGLLPQNFSFPPGFLLPTMWKSLAGNLLSETVRVTSANQQPARIAVTDESHLTIWDPEAAKPIANISLPCQSTHHVGSADQKTIYVGCSQQPQLYSVTWQTGEKQAIDLPAPVFDMVSDPDSQRLYVSYSGLPEISVVNTSENKIVSKINLKRPASLLAISPFRKQLYALTDMSKVEQPKPAVKSKKRKNQEQVVRQIVPTVQVIDLATTPRFDKSIPALPDVSTLYVQDEKILWMISASQKSMLGFDMRWQEFSQPLTLTEIPTAMASDQTGLYLLLPEANQIAHFNVKNSEWGKPVSLKSDMGRPVSMLLDPVSHVAYVVSEDKPSMQLVNLRREEWVGVETLALSGTSKKLGWASPITATPDEQVRIKFQDGRMMLQTSKDNPVGKLLTSPHVQEKIQSPSAPANSGSTP